MINVYSDPRCLEHRAPAGYPEHPGRLEAVLEAVEEQIQQGEGWRLMSPCSHSAAQELAEAVHDAEYLRRFRRAVERGDGLLDSADNPLHAATWDAALAAVEAALTAADAALSGAGGGDDVHFAAIRPPGHHAERSTAMGFCYLATAALVAEHWRRSGLQRVAVLDFDVHHGNGTQHLFEDRGDILFLSTHQSPFYPGTGAREERGVGDGLGATVNVPLVEGSGAEAVNAAWDEILAPALEAFQPEGLVVSAGFDAWRQDPLGGLRWELDTFEGLGERLGAFASAHCAGRMVSVLEGGYDVSHLGALVTAYLQGCSRGVGHAAQLGS
ncbi:MAG: histone deacetylase [Acidobacteriota bacterium]